METILLNLSKELEYKRSFLCVTASSFSALCTQNMADMSDLEKLQAAARSYDEACQEFITVSKARS